MSDRFFLYRQAPANSFIKKLQKKITFSGKATDMEQMLIGVSVVLNNTVANGALLKEVRKYYSEFTGGKITTTSATTDNSSSTDTSTGGGILSGWSLGNVTNVLKFYGIYTLLFFLLIFVLYMAFMPKGGLV